MNNNNPVSFIEPVVSGLVKVVKWLADNTTIVLGIVLFTIFLKLITLGFDYWSRRAMRKNSLLMEEMRPDLEKLQKQYANDKVLYNQKMQALYKKNGYSVVSACLPSIITIVIFVIAFGGLTGYASFQTRKYYYDMSVSYNQVIYDGFDTDGTFIKKDGNNFIIDYESLYEEVKNEEVEVIKTKNETIKIQKKNISAGDNTISVFDIWTANGYVKYRVVYSVSGSTVTFGDRSFIADKDLLLSTTKPAGSNFNSEDDAIEYIYDVCGNAAKDVFYGYKKEMKFLWVANIWQPDSSCAHPVDTSNQNLYESSCNSCSCLGTKTTAVSQDDFNKIVSKLGSEQTQKNGLFIFAIITAGVSLALQLITMKGQKAQMELQTVDGQGMESQKMMLWMMPIMMAIFSFSMTTAFSIYLIVSSLFSMLSTVIINAIVDKQFAKEHQNKNGNIIRGRVHDEKPKEQPVKKEKEQERGDFITGRVGKKHVRRGNKED